MVDVAIRRSWQKLAPVRAPWRWILAGLPLQAIGVCIPAAYLVSKASREGIGGHITAATFRLVWRGQAHTKVGLMLLVVGAVLFAAGSALIARPYVRRPVLLLAVVPLAGIVGMLLLGVFALLLVFLTDVGGPDVGGGSDKRRRDSAKEDEGG
ncbi:MAG: hypothetical protein M3063_11375 [Actinomycetota bacterium]|nr:hypothetical protein [Actinomycetota bacterium]